MSRNTLTHTVKLPHLFKPYPFQKVAYDKFFKEGIRNQLWVDHRRSGKDLRGLPLLVTAACQTVGPYLYLFPEATQLRKVIWRGIDKDGISFLDRIPKHLIAGKPNNTELFVKLINGSLIQFGGTDNPDAWRGLGARGIIWSEAQHHNPRAFEVMSPMIVQTKGWQIIQGTPLGKNHFYRMYQFLKQLPDWYVKVSSVAETTDWDGNPLITEEQIENERKRGVSEESIRQEYYCDWNVGVQGAYYTEQMDKAELEDRICKFDINPAVPVYTFWDIGVSDATSIWFMQPNGNTLDFVYYLEKTDKGPDYFAAQLRDLQARFGFNYHQHFGPHDLNQRRWGYSARSSISLARDEGINFTVVPDVGIENGIQAARAIFSKCRFHVEHCSLGIDALKEYRREWDEDHKVFRQKPLHNWASNGADAFRYFAVHWSDAFNHPHGNNPRKFENLFLK